MTRYGIFGCSADPFTAAHYAIVNKVLENRLVDKVIVAPSVVSYYRTGKTQMFDDNEKQAIVSRWFEDRPDVITYFDEFGKQDRAGRRYWLMFNDIVFKYGRPGKHGRPGDVFYTIIGRDSLNNLKTWYNWNAIYEASPLIVVDRGGAALVGGDLDYENVVIDPKFLDYSATKVREQLKAEHENNPEKSTFEIYLEKIAQYKENR